MERASPLKGLNFLLLTVWTVGFWGFTFVQFLYRQMFGVCMGLKAGIKGLEFLAGLVQIIGQNWLFSLLMIVVPVLHFTLTRSLLKRRVSVLGKLTGANWMAPLGAWLLSAILIFAGVVLGLRGTAGEPSDRQLLMTRFDAEASLQSFGAAPEFLLDVKYNGLVFHSFSAPPHKSQNGEYTEKEGFSYEYRQQPGIRSRAHHPHRR